MLLLLFIPQCSSTWDGSRSTPNHSISCGFYRIHCTVQEKYKRKCCYVIIWVKSKGFRQFMEAQKQATPHTNVTKDFV